MKIRNLYNRNGFLIGRNLSNVSTARSSALVDLQTSAKIDGDETQVATIKLNPGQQIRAESGSMVFMTNSIQMETTSSMSDGMKRFMTGQSLFVTDFKAKDAPGEVALAPAFPSKILRINLEEYGGELICQKGAYIASNHNVDIDLAFTKNFSAGFFGGEGFVLQRLSGSGDVLLQACGNLTRREMMEGETLRVSSGTLVGFTNRIEFDVQMMPGFKNVIFGGEGLFVTTLKGPGTVWLQSMPPDRMISEISRKVPSGGIGLGIPIGIGSGGGGIEDSVEGEDENSVDNIDTSNTNVDDGGMGSDFEYDESVNSESPEALFGDVATNAQDDNFLDNSKNVSENSENEMDYFESTKISTDEFEEDFSNFSDDETSFSTYDDNAGTGDESFDSEEIDTDSVTETASNILSKLWDMFSGDD